MRTRTCYPLLIVAPFSTSTQREAYIGALLARFILPEYEGIEHLIAVYPLPPAAPNAPVPDSFAPTTPRPPSDILTLLTTEVDLFVAPHARSLGPNTPQFPQRIRAACPRTTASAPAEWAPGRLALVADDPAGESVVVLQVDAYELHLRRTGEVDEDDEIEEDENKTRGYAFAAEFLGKDVEWARENAVMGIRIVPEEAPLLVSNLDISNMEMETWVGAVDEDGVFRAFP